MKAIVSPSFSHFAPIIAGSFDDEDIVVRTLGFAEGTPATTSNSKSEYSLVLFCRFPLLITTKNRVPSGENVATEEPGADSAKRVISIASATVTGLRVCCSCARLGNVATQRSTTCRKKRAFRRLILERSHHDNINFTSGM